jgi:hypothetical protein
MDSAVKAVAFLHGKFGVPVLPDGADLADGIRFFPQKRFEVVYMEGTINILRAILVLHGVESQADDTLATQAAEILENPHNLATTTEVFAAAERAINSVQGKIQLHFERGKAPCHASGRKRCDTDNNDAVYHRSGQRRFSCKKIQNRRKTN